MSDVTLSEARNHLSALIHRVEAGEEIAITRRGKVVARLVSLAPVEADQRARGAVARLIASREGIGLARLSGRDLIRAGRR